MATVIVERTFEEPITKDCLANLREQHGWCFETNEVTYLGSYLSLDGRRVLCIYEAPDAEAVRRGNKMGELPADRVWPANVFER